jgi:hypothetical protein
MLLEPFRRQGIQIFASPTYCAWTPGPLRRMNAALVAACCLLLQRRVRASIQRAGSEAGAPPFPRYLEPGACSRAHASAVAGLQPRSRSASAARSAFACASSRCSAFQRIAIMIRLRPLGWS